MITIMLVEYLAYHRVQLKYEVLYSGNDLLRIMKKIFAKYILK